MGMMTRGTVSMAVRMPLYDDMNTSDARSHVTTNRRLPSVRGSHSVARKEQIEIYTDT